MRKRFVVAGAVVAALAGGGYWGADRLANDVTAARAERIAASLRPHLRELRYGSARADLLDQAIELRDIAVVTKTGDRLRIASVTIRDFEWGTGGPPRYADIVARGIEAQAGDSEAGRRLREFGLDGTTSDHRFRYRYDDGARSFEVMEYRAEVAGVGTLAFKAKLGNVGPDLADRIARNPRELQTAGIALLQTSLVHASLSFEDTGLVDRLVRRIAAARAISEPEARRWLLQGLEEEKGRVTFDAQRRILDALGGFVRKPGTIGIGAEPRPPVLAMELLSVALGADRAALERRFNVTVWAR